MTTCHTQLFCAAPRWRAGFKFKNNLSAYGHLGWRNGFC